MSYNIRMNVMNINSIKSFAGIKGRFFSNTKDVYFTEISGVDNSEELVKQIYDMDYMFIGKQGYIRVNSLENNISYDDINYYSNSYENDSYSIKYNMNTELKNAYINGINNIKKIFIDNTPNLNNTILKNFIIKIMYWSDLYLPKIFEVYNINYSYKFVYCGNIKRNEYMFLYLLIFLGVDVLYVDYEKTKNFNIKSNYKPYVINYNNKQKLNIKEFENQIINKEINKNIEKSKLEIHKNNSIKEVIKNKKELDFEEISKFASKVVMINVLNENGECFKTGSGFFAGKNGIILTNFHVIQCGVNFAVRIENDDNVYMTDEIIKYDYTRDLAIIRIDYNTEPLNIYNGENNLVRGQKVAAIGSPLGLFNSVSDGIISGFRNIDDKDFIQFTAPVSHGSSGGALFNMYGQVIGIITAGYDEGQNINLAVNYNMINMFIKGFK